MYIPNFCIKTSNKAVTIFTAYGVFADTKNSRVQLYHVSNCGTFLSDFQLQFLQEYMSIYLKQLPKPPRHPAS